MRVLKNGLKILLIISLLFCAVSLNYKVQADEVGIGDVITEGKDFINNGQDGEGKFTVDYFADRFVGVGQVLVVIGLITVTVVAVIMAIKWITAKPDQQAALKQQLIGLVVAIVVIFGALGIWGIVRSLMKNVEGELGVDIQEQGSQTQVERIYGING